MSEEPGRRASWTGIGRSLSFLASPAWRRAPLLLFRYPGLLAAVVAAAAVLSLASVAGPLFLSAAGNAALQDSVRAGCPWDVGLHVAGSFRFVEDGSGSFGRPLSMEVYGRDLERGVATDIPDLLPMERFGVGSSVQAVGEGGRSSTIRPAFRDGALDHVTKLGGGGQGIWLAASTAEAIRVQPGEDVSLASATGGETRIRVAGIYRDLASEPRGDFWCSQEHLIYPLSAFANFIPPPFGLVDAKTFATISERLEETGAQVTFEFQPRPGLTLPEARDTSARMRAEIPRVGEFVPFKVDARFPFLTDRAQATVESLRGPVETISIAGRVVALMVIAAAGLFWVGRRRAEVTLLSAKGTGPAALMAKVILEGVAPTAIGGVAGAVLGRWLVGWFAPTRIVDGPSVAAANRQVLWVVALAVVLLGTVAAVASTRAPARGRGGRRYLWEAAILALALAALYEIRTRGSAAIERIGEAPHVDRFLLLFPILFVAAGAGLVVRALRRLLPLLRSAGSRWPASLYLASRRLAGASGAALTLLVGASVAVGVLAYAATLRASVQATSLAKAAVFVGSDVDVTLVSKVDTPPRLGVPSTIVRRIERATADRQSGLDVIGIDTDTFSGAAFWDPGFAGDPLPDILQSLRGTTVEGRVPVAVTGGAVPESSLLRLGSGGDRVSIAVVLRVNSFPGMAAGSPLVIMDRANLREASRVGQDHVWARGDPQMVLAEVRRAGLAVHGSVSVADVRGTPQFLSLSWTFDFLRALGIMAGAIALAGGVLQMEARQREREVSYALARRMGLSRRAHRLSVALELGTILLLGVGIGISLAWLAAVLVLGQLDPFPNIPPEPLFRVPGGVLGITAAAAVAAAGAGAWWVQRTADRTRMAEVLRVAG